jgi:F0F1-type ATP synthase membrane subunit b/b'
VTDIRVQPDVLAFGAEAYGAVVRRVALAAQELSGQVSNCQGALDAEVAALGRSAEQALRALASDHQQVQTGLTAVASCYLQLDRALFR